MNRRIGIDILKIFSALMVFGFHTNIHIGCTYGVFTEFVNMSAIFMTTFFMISGWILYSVYSLVDLSKINNVKTFYLKRFASIIPLYYFVSIIYIIFLSDETIKANVVLAPVELLGLQSIFSSLFNISHNGGTWFISCLLICYFFYPFIQELIKQLSTKEKSIVAVLLVFLIIYSPLLVKYFDLQSIYTNPLIRGFEFTIGVLLSSFILGKVQKGDKLLLSFVSFGCEIIILIFLVTCGVNHSIEVSNYMYYDCLIVPMSIIMILTVSNVRVKNEVLIKSINYFSSLSYSFFLAQFFTWDVTEILIDKLQMHNNISHIIISFSVCIIFAIVLHELIERPIKKYLLRKLL